MTLLPLTLLLALALPPGQFEAGGVRIDVTLKSHLYTWTVTNVDAPPIVSFEIHQYGTTEEVAPEGWNLVVDGPHYLAWTDDPRIAIAPGGSKTFHTKVKSTGAALGLVPAGVGFAEGHPAVSFAAVWGPVPKRLSMVAIVTLTVAGLAAGHTLILERWVRRR